MNRIGAPPGFITNGRLIGPPSIGCVNATDEPATSAATASAKCTTTRKITQAGIGTAAMLPTPQSPTPMW